jgi:hypothetical protein
VKCVNCDGLFPPNEIVEHTEDCHRWISDLVDDFDAFDFFDPRIVSSPSLKLPRCPPLHTLQ